MLFRSPDWKPVPFTVRVWLEFDPVIGLGLSDEIDGGTDTGRFTMLELLVGEFTTCTVQVCTVAPKTTDTVSLLLFTNAGVTVDTAAPGWVRFTLEVAVKPLPKMVSVWLEAEPIMGLGLSDVMVKAGDALPQAVARA